VFLFIASDFKHTSSQLCFFVLAVFLQVSNPLTAVQSRTCLSTVIPVVAAVKSTENSGHDNGLTQLKQNTSGPS
jgi:hypothetical protein